MSKPSSDFDELPRVPISAFKANPTRYVDSGALVTNHGHVRAAFVPVYVDDSEGGAAIESVKAQLLLLSRIQPGEEVARQLAELSASREQDLVGRPR